MKNLTDHWKKHACAVAVLGAALAATGPAMAGPNLYAIFNTTMTLNGTVTNPSTNVDPFSVQLFSAGNECLRIAVTSQGTDLEATLVGPDGRTWRDDDSNGSLRPLIKAITINRGWHVLRVSHFAGSAVYADFTMQVSRFASTSSLCSPPTPPSLTAAPIDSAKPNGPVQNLPGGTSE